MGVNSRNFTQYLEPRSLEELYSLNSEWGGRAKIIAGGTDLLVRMKQGICEPEALISLRNVEELTEISTANEGVYIGAAVKLSDLISSPLIKEDYPLLAEATAKVGAYQHRYMGTLGGNLCLETRCLYYNQSHFLRDSLSSCLKAGGETCHAVKGPKCYAVYSGDTAPALLALGAKVLIGSAAGERREDLSKLYSGQGLAPLSLQEGEVLSRVFIGKEAAQAGGVYLKLAERVSIDFPTLGVAAGLTLADNKICRAGLALTAAGSAPFLLEKAKNLVGAEQLEEALLEPILEETNKRAIFLKNNAVNLGYRRAMLKKMVRAALEIAWEKAKGLEGGCCRG